MNNRPHSREKRVVDKAVKVEKKKIERNTKSTGATVIKGILSNLIKK